MKLPAIHTLALAPARHLIACEQVARHELWHEHPALRLLQQWQVGARWLLARYVLTPPVATSAHSTPRHGIARRLCAEVCTEMEIETDVIEPHLAPAVAGPEEGARQQREHESLHQGGHAVPEGQARRHLLQHMIERVIDIQPDTPLFDARVLAMGKAFDRHLTQTLARVARRSHRPEWLHVGPQMADRRAVLLSEMALNTGA